MALRSILLMSLLIFCRPVFAEETSPASLTLVTDMSSIAVGGTLQAGVLFQMKPHWHIYWREPGDAGLPTRIRFTLPEGSNAGELLWPIHEKFVLPGDIKANGYSNEVLLWAPIKVERAPAGDALTIQTDVAWLNCSDDVCLREKKTLSKEIPIGESKQSKEAALFAEWRTRLPKD